MVQCLIVGSGLMSQGIARQFNIHHCSEYTNHSLAVGKSRLSEVSEGPTHVNPSVPFVDLESSLKLSDIVILAIPSSAYRSFLSKHASVLSQCILVDICNPRVPGENLAAALEDLQCCECSVTTLDCGMEVPVDDLTCSNLSLTKNLRWVKAFNDIGGVDLISRSEALPYPFSTCMCGNDDNAVQTVRVFAEEALGFHVTVLPGHHNAVLMESYQIKLGRDWWKAISTVVVIFLLTYTYDVVYFLKMSKESPAQLPLAITNKAFAWTSITGFSLTQLPGTTARIITTWNKIIRKQYNHKLPQWLVGFLSYRKHLGLLSLFCLSVHAIISLLIFSALYSERSFNVNTGVLNAKASWSMIFAILGFMMYAVTGISSLPSVSKAMTCAQIRFVFGVLVWIALILALAHIMVLGAQQWSQPESWPGGMPPIGLTSSVIPSLIVCLKIVQTVLCRYATAF